MTPKEIAKQLFDKYIFYVESISESQQIGNAKECASIFIDGMYYENFHNNMGVNSIERMTFWKEVKKELGKL